MAECLLALSEFALPLPQIYHCYAYSENNVLSYSVMTLQAAHMFLGDGFYHINPLHENQIF
jgi:hypothetical protein